MNDTMKSSRESSGASISIDIGGTFTDCYLGLDGRVSWGKASTTPDDFSRGFLNALAEASSGLEIEVEDLLAGAASPSLLHHDCAERIAAAFRPLAWD